ncbi:MAG: hypothetical protein KKC05_01020, partial [Nanoarchaeota archaeon]|nr:hypothetical protein [Nanoarchaeota archaeon]
MWLDKKLFERSLYDTNFFRNVVRKAAYMVAGDAESVHELALEKLNEHEDVLQSYGKSLDDPELKVNIVGHEIMPFGPAAGLDKNGDALKPLSHIFGFLVPGTSETRET